MRPLMISSTCGICNLTVDPESVALSPNELPKRDMSYLCFPREIERLRRHRRILLEEGKRRRFPGDLLGDVFHHFYFCVLVRVSTAFARHHLPLAARRCQPAD